MGQFPNPPALPSLVTLGSSAVPFNFQQTLSHFRPNGLSIIQIIIWISPAMEILFQRLHVPSEFAASFVVVDAVVVVVVASVYCVLLCAPQQKLTK